MNRVNQVRVALVGYQPGDRVIVFQDTGSQLLGVRGADVKDFPQAGVVLDPVGLGVSIENRRAECLLVRLDHSPYDNGRVEGWWVFPRDLRPE